MHPWKIKSWPYLDELSPFVKCITYDCGYSKRMEVSLARYCVLNSVLTVQIFSALTIFFNLKTAITFHLTNFHPVLWMLPYPAILLLLVIKFCTYTQDGEAIYTELTQCIFFLLSFSSILFQTLTFIHVIPHLSFNSAIHCNLHLHV